MTGQRGWWGAPRAVAALALFLLVVSLHPTVLTAASSTHIEECHGEPNVFDKEDSAIQVTNANGDELPGISLGEEGFIETLEETAELHIFIVDFAHVKSPLLVVIVLLVVSFARALFATNSIGKNLPDSCMVIIIGIVLGAFLRLSSNSSFEVFDEYLFFVFILPPIIFESGYAANNRVFMENLLVILTMALAGTVFNTFAIGYTMYGLAPHLGIDNLREIDGLVFGALIAAVDPVAVLTVFEEMHVNERLHVIVFGESLLNDGVAIVLYRICVALAYEGSVSDVSIPVEESLGLGLAAFIVVFLGGFLVGVLHGFFAGWVTKNVPEDAAVIEPLLVILIGFMSYLVAEIFHFSGIVSIMVCGMLMKHYVTKNIRDTSRISVDYFLKITAGVMETLIFILLGIELVTNVDNGWNSGFIFLAFFACLGYRAIGVWVFTWLLSYFGSTARIQRRDKFVMAYGGLRGAIAFALAFVLLRDRYVCAEDEAHHLEGVIPFQHRDLFLSTTIMITMLTIFVQGTTIRPLLGLLHVALHDPEHAEAGFEKFQVKMLDNITKAMEAVVAAHKSSWWRDTYWHIDKFMSKIILKEGAKYKHYADALDQYEEQEVRKLLAELRNARKAALANAEEQGLDEFETENLLRMKTHENFQNVLKEMHEVADDLLVEEPTKLAPSDSLTVPSVEYGGGSPGRPSDGIPSRGSFGAKILKTLVQKNQEDGKRSPQAKKKQGDFAQQLPHVANLQQRRPSMIVPLSDDHRSLSSPLLARREMGGSRESLMAPSDTSEPFSIEKLLSDKERRRLKRTNSDSCLTVRRSRIKAFIEGEAWIPAPTVARIPSFDSAHHGLPAVSSENLYSPSLDDLDYGDEVPIMEYAV